MIETDKQPKKLFLVYVMAVVATSNRYRPQLHTTSAASAWLKEQADSSPAEQRADSPWSEAATSTDRTALISFDRSTSRPSLLLRSRLGTVQLTGDAGRDYDGRPPARPALRQIRIAHRAPGQPPQPPPVEHERR